MMFSKSLNKSSFHKNIFQHQTSLDIYENLRREFDGLSNY